MKTKAGIYRNTFQKVIAFTTMFFFITSASFSQQPENKLAKATGYAPVNGLKMYYEIYGEGKPLILLHGAFMTINTNYGAMIPELAKTRKVIAVELQGHGHTADIDRPFSAESMADDVAALLQYLKIDNTDVFGYSLGGEVALQMAIRHPQMVRKLIVVSATYKSDGWSPETRAIFPMLNPAIFEGSPMKKEYDSVAPDPKHFPELVNKIKQMNTVPYDFTAEKIKAIKSPTLIVIGDGDGVLPEHAVEMYRLLGGNYMVDFGPVHKTQLAILPGTSHISVMMQTNQLLAMTTTFLDAAMPVH